MSRRSKRRITHLAKCDEGQPIYEELVSGIIKEIDSNKYGDKIISFNLLKQRKTVNKTNSTTKCRNKQTKNVDKKHPLMEKTQKSVMYLKHNRKIPKQRAHISSFGETSKLPVKKKLTEEFAKCIKDTKLTLKKRFVKNKKLVNGDFSIASKKKGESKFNFNKSESKNKTINSKNTSVTSASNELDDKTAQTCSDSDDKYENFIRSHKVASSGSFAKTVKRQRKRKKKFKRIKIRSDTESDCETLNKVCKKISFDEPSKVDFNGPESSNVDYMKPRAVPEDKYSVLNETFQKVNSDYTIRSNKQDSSGISKGGGCAVRFVRNPFLGREVLTGQTLNNNLEQDIQTNLNFSGNIKHMYSSNREIEDEYLMSQNNFVNDLDFSDKDVLSDTFLEDILRQSDSENNLHLSYNTQYIPSNKDRIDELLLKNNSKDFDFLDRGVISDIRLDHNNSKYNRTSQTYSMQQIVPHNEETGRNSSGKSNSSDNTPNNLLNNVDNDGDLFMLNTFKNDSANRSYLDCGLLRKDSNDEDCIIVCEVPKCPRNLSYSKNKDNFINRKNLDGNLFGKNYNIEEINDCLILYEAPKFPQSLSDIKNKEVPVNRSNLDGNILGNTTNNEEMDKFCRILSEVNNFPQNLCDMKTDSKIKSNLDGNLLREASNNEEMQATNNGELDEFYRILSEINNLPQNSSDPRKDDSTNKSNLDGNLLREVSTHKDMEEECIILCEVPKFPPNSVDVRTMHKKSDNSNQIDENGLKVNFPILSSNSTNREIDQTRLLTKNNPSSLVNTPHSLQYYIFGDKSTPKMEEFGKNIFNSKDHPNLLKKDYFMHAKRYCNPIPDKKNKPNENNS